MKSIFIAGSRKFFDEINDVVELLKKNDIEVKTAGKSKDDTDEKDTLLRAFQRIDDSDIVYVFSKEGYVGKTVVMEIAYAFSKGKQIISSEEITEASAKALVSDIKKPEELVVFIQ